MKKLSYLMVLVLTLALTSCTDSPTVPKEQPTTVPTLSLENQIVVGDLVRISVSCIGPGIVRNPVFPQLGVPVVEVSFDDGPRFDLRCPPMVLQTVRHLSLLTNDVGGSWGMVIFLSDSPSFISDFPSFIVPTCIFEGTTPPIDPLTCTFRDTVFGDPPLSDDIDERFLNSGVEVQIR